MVFLYLGRRKFCMRVPFYALLFAVKIRTSYLSLLCVTELPRKNFSFSKPSGKKKTKKKKYRKIRW